jgi:hypothetical protein
LHWFGEMFRGDTLGMVQIRDGPGDLQHAVMGTPSRRRLAQVVDFGFRFGR